ncbi:MAG: hypothetical protein ACK4F9_01165 [Brevinematia bacterium]
MELWQGVIIETSWCIEGKIPLYLEEIEYRYNMRDNDIFDKLIDLLGRHKKMVYNR